MIIRFHNLAARVPTLIDLEAVTALLIACDTVESYIAEPTLEEVRQAWESSAFCLQTDAWVITTNQGKLVGYGDVRHEQAGHLVSTIRVHPDYRGRGIGTLLIWLVEDRARQLALGEEQELQVTLSITVSSQDQGAHQLLDREGYSLLRHFWRLVIDVDEISRSVQGEAEDQRKLKLDLLIDSRSLLGDAVTQRRTGMYVAHQYDVYEKTLRSDKKTVREQHKEKSYVPA